MDLPDPAGAVRNMLSWLARGGLLVIEVPYVGGWGGVLFHRHWAGLDFPRDLIHVTPTTMRALVGQCGGRVVDEGTGPRRAGSSSARDSRWPGAGPRRPGWPWRGSTAGSAAAS